MTRIISILFIVLTSHSLLQGADNYKKGDTLYTWAKNGLIIRNGPGVNHEALSSLQFGDIAIVRKRTQVSYNVEGISGSRSIYTGKSIDPVIFRGFWVEIVTSQGIVGYVIDQYFIRYKPKNKSKYNTYRLNLEITTTDTLYYNLNIFNDEGLFLHVRSKYENGVALLEKMGSGWGSSTYSIPEMTIEEVLILFSATFDNFKSFKVYKNWQEEIVFSDDEQCFYTVKLEGIKTLLSKDCAC